MFVTLVSRSVNFPQENINEASRQNNYAGRLNPQTNSVQFNIRFRSGPSLYNRSAIHTAWDGTISIPVLTVQTPDDAITPIKDDDIDQLIVKN